MLNLTYMILQNKIISHLRQANYCGNVGKCKCNIIFGHVRMFGSLSDHLLYCLNPNNCVYLFWKEIKF